MLNIRHFVHSSDQGVRSFHRDKEAFTVFGRDFNSCDDNMTGKISEVILFPEQNP